MGNSNFFIFIFLFRPLVPHYTFNFSYLTLIPLALFIDFRALLFSLLSSFSSISSVLFSSFSFLFYSFSVSCPSFPFLFHLLIILSLSYIFLSFHSPPSFSLAFPFFSVYYLLLINYPLFTFLIFLFSSTSSSL